MYIRRKIFGTGLSVKKNIRRSFDKYSKEFSTNSYAHRTSKNHMRIKRKRGEKENNKIGS
jgi:hypothetical protein